MNFVSIPQNGSSWQEPLIYSIASEDGSATDVVVDIFDLRTKQTVATKRLYGVSVADIDIAPYLRQASQMTIDASNSGAIIDTKLSKYIRLIVNGVPSESRIFLPSGFDTSKMQMLSSVEDSQKLEVGGTILFTLFAPTAVTVVATCITPVDRREYQVQWSGINGIVDVVLPTSQFPISTMLVNVDIYSGSTLFKCLTYSIVRQENTTRRLYWRKEDGGVDSYNFPHWVRLAASVSVEQFETTTASCSKLRSAKRSYRLCSAFESHDEIERITEIIRAPYIYEIVSNKAREVKLDSRTIEYGSHGKLRQLSLEITEEWKGGAK